MKFFICAGYSEQRGIFLLSEQMNTEEIAIEQLNKVAHEAIFIGNPFFIVSVNDERADAFENQMTGKENI